MQHFLSFDGLDAGQVQFVHMSLLQTVDDQIDP